MRQDCRDNASQPGLRALQLEWNPIVYRRTFQSRVRRVKTDLTPQATTIPFQIQSLSLDTNFTSRPSAILSCLSSKVKHSKKG